MTEQRSEPGLSPGSTIHYGMSFEDYCELDGINASLLKGDGRHSPKHLKAAIEKRIANNDTPDRRFGRVIHGFNLEPKTFAAQFPRALPCAAVIKSGDRKGELCGSQGTLTMSGLWYCGMKSHAPEGSQQPADYVTESEFKRLERQREALQASSANEHLRRPGYSEVVIQWQQFGLTLKTRIDRLSTATDPITIIDLKKCQVGKADYEEAQRACLNNLYYVQAWFNIAGTQAAFGADRPIDANFLFIEDNEPFDTYLLPVDMEQDIEQIADPFVVGKLTDYVRCQKAGDWPGCQRFINPDKRGILPAWYVKKLLQGAK